MTMEIKRYYIQGQSHTVADVAQNSNDKYDVIIEMIFPNQDALDWFEQGLGMHDGWLEVNSYDTLKEAQEAVDEVLD